MLIPKILELICGELTSYADIVQIRNMNRMSRVTIGMHFLLRKIANSTTHGAQWHICGACGKLGADNSCTAFECDKRLCRKCVRVCCECDYCHCPNHAAKDEFDIIKCVDCYYIKLPLEQDTYLAQEISHYSGSVPIDVVRIIAEHLAIADIMSIRSMSWIHHVMIEARIGISQLLPMPESGLSGNMCIGCRIKIPYLNCASCDGEFCKDCCFARCSSWMCLRSICRYCYKKCDMCGNILCDRCYIGLDGDYFCPNCFRGKN